MVPPCVLLALAAGALAPRFVDVAGERGPRFDHRIGAPRAPSLLEATGSGACAFDADGDGDDDAFLVEGARDADTPLGRLFLNASGRFEEARGAVATSPSGFGMGCVAADFEGDGDLDLFVTAHGPDELLLNDGHGRFRAAGAAAGLDDARWNTGAALADFDLDGDLDLYVGAYVDLPQPAPRCTRPRGLDVICRPFEYAPIPNRLYRNDGPDPSGTPRFTDVTASAGVADAHGKTLGVVFEDLTQDELPDLFVANDTVRSSLYVNRGDGTFHDASLRAGVGLSAQGMPQASMGIDVGDLDGDLAPEIVVTNFQGETNTIWRALSPQKWQDVTDSSGAGPSSLPFLAWGVHFADFDADADLDLFVVNGHVDDRIADYEPGSQWAQRDQLLDNVSASASAGAVRLAEAPPAAIEASVRSGRGSALLDADQDGDLDVLVSENAAPATLLDNRTAREGRHWLEVELAAGAPNPFAIGARIFALGHDGHEGRVQQRCIRTASSYASSSPPRAWFGLGAARTATVVVRWPDGAVSSHVLDADRRHRLAHP